MDAARNPPLTSRTLYEKLRERLDLRWIAGQRGAERALQVETSSDSRSPSLVGYLNLIHANRLQIIGREELGWLDHLDPRQRWEVIAGVIARAPTALIVANRLEVPADLRDAANDAGTPLWSSARRGHEILSYLQYFLGRAIALRTTVHGVFLEVYSLGVLITGEAGSGKSELALELLTRGHRLVADDAPEFTLIEPDVIDGGCPALLQDCLEVRGLGVLNVREMFGDSAVKRNKYLRLVIHLDSSGDLERVAGDRLTGARSQHKILDVNVPMITIPVAPGRNIAVLVEAAVRDHLLRLKGVDSAQRFIERQRAQIDRDDQWL